jgi:hypothetical protein
MACAEDGRRRRRGDGESNHRPIVSTWCIVKPCCLL